MASNIVSSLACVVIILFLALCLPGHAVEQAARFAEHQCRSVQVSKGSGEGRLEYCDNGTDQQIYLSGELDITPTDRSKESAANDPRKPKGSYNCPSVGSSNARLRGSIVAAASPRTGKISTAAPSRS